MFGISLTCWLWRHVFDIRHVILGWLTGRFRLTRLHQGSNLLRLLVGGSLVGSFGLDRAWCRRLVSGLGIGRFHTQRRSLAGICCVLGQLTFHVAKSRWCPTRRSHKRILARFRILVLFPSSSLHGLLAHRQRSILIVQRHLKRRLGLQLLRALVQRLPSSHSLMSMNQILLVSPSQHDAFSYLLIEYRYSVSYRFRPAIVQQWVEIQIKPKIRNRSAIKCRQTLKGWWWWCGCGPVKRWLRACSAGKTVFAQRCP